LRALDETEFWKHQETEHAGLIPLVTPNLETKYVQRLGQLKTELSTMNAEAAKYITSITRSKGAVSRALRSQMINFVKRCVEQSQGFTMLMTDMLQNSGAVSSNPSSQEVIRHMIRESQYYIGIGQLILS